MDFDTTSADNALKLTLESVGKRQRIVISGSPNERQMLDEQAEYQSQSISEIIAASNTINPEIWLKEKEREMQTEFEGDDFDLSEIVGVWPGKLPSQDFTLNIDILTQKPLQSVLTAKMDVENPWEIPAHFKYGNWNDCPAPEVHCAIWRYWYESYGAHIVGVSHDVIEAFVESPPKNQTDAMTLAWQQYWYCYDIVDQGAETVSNLGAILLDHKSWYFWWD